MNATLTDAMMITNIENSILCQGIGVTQIFKLILYRLQIDLKICMLLFPQWRNQFWIPIGGYDGEGDN